MPKDDRFATCKSEAGWVSDSQVMLNEKEIANSVNIIM